MDNFSYDKTEKVFKDHLKNRWFNTLSSSLLKLKKNLTIVTSNMAASNSPLKNITREEVSKHNTIESAWMIIDNKIYDLTKFVQEHPCGMAVLTQYAGKDCTKEFRFMDGGHSPSAYAQKEFYLIGEVNEVSYKYDRTEAGWIGGVNDIGKEEKLIYQFDEDKESQEIHNKCQNKDSQCIPSTQTMTECPFVKQNGQTGKVEECDHAK